MNLNDLILLNKDKTSFSKENPNFIKNYNGLIAYIDKIIFTDETIIQALIAELKSQNPNIELNTYNVQTKNIEVEKIYNYFSNLKVALIKLIYKNDDFFNFTIFREVKEIVKFCFKKSLEKPYLSSYKISYNVLQYEYHAQCESFKYLFSVFDKLTYIVNHMYCKYVIKNNDESKEMLKFYCNFLKDIEFLTRSQLHYQNLQYVVQSLTKSKGWHLVRKLRNYLEHDFVNPTCFYNINPYTDLLFIYVCRIMIAIDENIVSDKQIWAIIKKLKNNI